jgi:hypothetical protein
MDNDTIYHIKGDTICESSSVDSEGKGRPIQCQSCGKKFRLLDESERYDWEYKNNLECPFCKELRCNKPKQERKLFLLQDKYLQTFSKEPNNLIVHDLRNKRKIESELYIELVSYSRSLLLKHFRSLVKDSNDIDKYSHDATCYLLEKYYRVDKDKWLDFKIKDSFAGMFVSKGKRGLLAQVIFSKHEKSCSGDDGLTLDYQFIDNSYVEHEDKSYKILSGIDDTLDIYNIINHITEVIISLKSHCKSNSENFKRLVALQLYYTKGESAFDRFFKYNGNSGKAITLKTIEIIKKELSFLTKK